MCSHWQANSVASRRILPSRSMRRVWASSMSVSWSLPAAASRMELVVGLRRPEEIAEPAGQLVVGDRALARARARPLDAVQERRPDEHAGQRQAEGLVVASPSCAACAYRDRAARATPVRSAAGDRRGRRNRAGRRAGCGSVSISRLRNAAARSLIGLRSGSKTVGSASWVAYSSSWAKASTSVSASWLTNAARPRAGRAALPAPGRASAGRAGRPRGRRASA